MIFGVIARPTLHKHAGQAVQIAPALKNGQVVILDGGRKEYLDFFCFNSFYGDSKEDAETALNLTEQLQTEIETARRILKETTPTPSQPPASCYSYSQLLKLNKTELLKLLVKETSNKGLIRGPEDADKFIKEFSGLVTNWDKEHFIGLYLDTKNFVKHAEIISIGHLTASLVHQREVLAPALKYKAAGLIVGHNHPSGDPEPSENDKEITDLIKNACKALGLPLLDHIIFSKDGRFYSFNEKGKI